LQVYGLTGQLCAMSPSMPTDMPPERARVLLGVITTVHGIRGDVIIRSYTGCPEDISAYGALETARGETLPQLTIVRVSHRGVIARLAGVSDRTTAEGYKGTELWIARDRLPPPAEGEYYHADLLGLEAFNPAGVLIGTVLAVENFGAGDLLDIKLAGTLRSEYVPFTNACVPTVDLAARRMTVIMPVMIEPDDGEGADDSPTD
jgi:16S rRNA processing protein RimM